MKEREVVLGAMPICEISSESTVPGRRPIRVALHEIFQSPDEYQKNGISWNEEYTRNNMQSVIGMSIVAEFLSEERDVPHGHGMTEIREDNLPLFENATMVGHFDKVYIGSVTVSGTEKTALIAEGTLDEMRYPKFVQWLRESMADGNAVGSVEIVGKPENDQKIIYSGGWKKEGRVPQIYDYSGYAILGVAPADDTAIVMELNSKKTDKEEHEMDEKFRQDVMDAVSGAISETNSKWEEYNAKVQAKDAEIAQLYADIQMKEAEIAQLRADYEKAEADLAASQAGLTEANAKIAALENEKAKIELNNALAAYSEEQRAIAADDITAFNENPGGIAEINAIVGKICTEIVRVSREEAPVVEKNDLDIFGMTGQVPNADPDGDEVNIY